MQLKCWHGRHNLYRWRINLIWKLAVNAHSIGQYWCDHSFIVNFGMIRSIVGSPSA
jgi:hypothetical protein